MWLWLWLGLRLEEVLEMLLVSWWSGVELGLGLEVVLWHVSHVLVLNQWSGEVLVLLLLRSSDVLVLLLRSSDVVALKEGLVVLVGWDLVKSWVLLGHKLTDAIWRVLVVLWRWLVLLFLLSLVIREALELFRSFLLLFLLLFLLVFVVVLRFLIGNVNGMDADGGARGFL